MTKFQKYSASSFLVALIFFIIRVLGVTFAPANAIWPKDRLLAYLISPLILIVIYLLVLIALYALDAILRVLWRTFKWGLMFSKSV